ncbi:MAG: sensor histidine kinase, partial [Vicinamibacterales bacterium]
GRAVDVETTDALMREPLPSEGGLGIGLYQAARQARASGYELRLAANRDGEVCFVLRPAAPLGQQAGGDHPGV